ncbi:MAG: beta-ketoacyl synthase N-terminal-like domain-containing protein, partial [Bryobacteraceae bacterium]
MKTAYTTKVCRRADGYGFCADRADPNMTPAVVVTGIGAVSPNGAGREAFWQATRTGVSGIGALTRFDASSLAVQVAGEIHGFDESRYVAPKDRPHVSRVTPLAIAAVEEALADAGLDPPAM